MHVSDNVIYKTQQVGTLNCHSNPFGGQIFVVRESLHLYDLSTRCFWSVSPCLVSAAHL